MDKSAPAPDRAILVNDMSGLKNFDTCGNQSSVGIRWTKWIRSFELFAVGKGVKEHDQKKTLLLHCTELKKMVQTDNVFLFIPNIIDYLRLVMIISFSFHAWQGDYKTAAICYVINFALDEVDGNSARFLGQTSLFGMLLDILLDETSVLALSMVLCTLYPQFQVLFQFYSAIDFSAQWSNYQFSAMYRNNNFTASDDWLIKTYFNNYIISCCWVYGNHLFLLMIYLCYYTSGPTICLLGWSFGLFKMMAVLAAPWSLSRLLIMVYLLFTSMRKIGEQDRLKRLGKSF